MNKFLKKLFTISGLVSIPTVLTLSSCAINKIVNSYSEQEETMLYTQFNYIMPGNKMQVYVLVGATIDTAEDYDWSVDAPSPEIWINRHGLLTVSSTAKFPKTVSIIINAKHRQTLVESSLKIFLISDAPESETNLLGFENNELTYVSRDYSTKSVDIVRDVAQKNLYYVSKPIDLFVGQILPPEFESWFNFKPIIRERQNKAMTFHCESIEKSYCPILWINYNDEFPTKKIPYFDVINPTHLHDRIVVTFKCDDILAVEAPKLVIDFNVWLSPLQKSPAVFNYDPKPGDLHSLTKSLTDGVYYAPACCPSGGGNYIYSQQMTSILCYRKLHEYLDLTFTVDYSHIDPRFANAFTCNFSVIETEPRLFDQCPMYIVNFFYSFDLSKMPSGEEADFETVTLVTLRGDDPLTESMGCSIVFNIKWI
ncbi:MAG: hypothetical protein KBS35_00420 [Mycoplasma sp.]|nr:hypothetical protein [Candidatus Hennigella equi]